MENNYAKAYKEVIEILKNVPKESVNKIPKEIIEIFNTNMDKDYKFKIDENSSFEEQNLLEETKAIFANIYRDYWATPYQKEKIEEKEKNDRLKVEEEKREKYNIDEIFKRRKSTINKIEENNDPNLPIEIKKEKFYQKLIKFIKRIFKI